MTPNEEKDEGCLDGSNEGEMLVLDSLRGLGFIMKGGAETMSKDFNGGPHEKWWIRDIGALSVRHIAGSGFRVPK